MNIREKSAKDAESSQGRRTGALSIFINYRRSEAGAMVRLLYEGLAGRFGPENVFLDVVTLQPGDRWLTDIRSRSTGAAAFIALIGPNWVSTLNERSQSPEEDQVRAEIEQALRKDSQVEMIVPTLIDDAEPPAERPAASCTRVDGKLAAQPGGGQTSVWVPQRSRRFRGSP